MRVDRCKRKYDKTKEGKKNEMEDSKKNRSEEV